MVFFLGAETIAPASNYWYKIRALINPRLLKLQDRYYGDGLDSIGIISIILPNRFFEDGGYKERRLYLRKTGEADIRLRIDYDIFIKATPDERNKIYIKHIIESVRTLEGKLENSFDFAKLMSDIIDVLNCQ